MNQRVALITDRIVSASATIIAIVAMATAVYQAKLMRDQARASVWPYLIVGNSGAHGFERVVQNVGLGPAIIKSFEVQVGGAPVHTWKEAAESLHVALSFKGATASTVAPGVVIPTGTTIDALALADSTDIRAFASRSTQLSTRVCYCSLYGDCWEAGVEGAEPKPVSQCVVDTTREFRQ